MSCDGGAMNVPWVCHGSAICPRNLCDGSAMGVPRTRHVHEIECATDVQWASDGCALRMCCGAMGMLWVCDGSAMVGHGQAMCTRIMLRVCHEYAILQRCSVRVPSGMPFMGVPLVCGGRSTCTPLVDSGNAVTVCVLVCLGYPMGMPCMPWVCHGSTNAQCGIGMPWVC